MRVCGLDLSGSVLEPEAESYEHGNELSDSSNQILVEEEENGDLHF